MDKKISKKRIDTVITKYNTTLRSINYIVDIVPEHPKYFEWLCKMKYIKDETTGIYKTNKSMQPKKYGEVAEMLVWFEKNSTNPKLPTKDINSFKTIESFEETLKPLMVKTKSQIKDDCDIVFEDDLFKVLIPKNYECMRLYAMSTKWCISNKQTYVEYTEGSSFLVVLLFKNSDRKFCVHIGDDEINDVIGDYYSFDIFNNEDDSIEFDYFASFFGMGYSRKLFKKVCKYGRLLNSVDTFTSCIEDNDPKKQQIDDKIKELVELLF